MQNSDQQYVSAGAFTVPRTPHTPGNPLRRALTILLVLLALGGCASDPSADTRPSAGAPSAGVVRPASYLLDAHDGEVVQVGDRFYQFGTSYGCGYALSDPQAPWCGVRMYSSPDLAVWTDEGLAFDPSGVWQERCVEGHFGCFRPHVAQRADGEFVMWLNSYDTQAGYWVFTAPAPTGPWTAVGQPALAVNLKPSFTHGDHDLTIAPDGTGYVTYTAIGGENNLHDLVVEKLDPTLTTGTGEYVRLGLELVEAPALFERQGTWYLTYSDPACPYCTTGTSYATAPAPLGPWTIRGSVSSDSCGGQPAAVNQVTVGGRVEWLWQVDQWLEGNPTQTAATTYLAPLAFADDGSIDDQVCRSSL